MNKRMDPETRIDVLRVLLTISETSAPYNQFSRPYYDSIKQKITICTFFEPEINAREGIELHKGNGTLRWFYKTLRKVLMNGEFDIINVHSPHLGVMILLANIFLGNPLQRAICTVHNSYPNFKLRNKLMFLPIFATFPRIVLCSNASFDSFPSLYRWLARDRLRVVPNGVNIERIEQALNGFICYKSSTKRIISVGRLIPIKNPLMTLTAFYQSDVQDATLTFIGEGPLKTTLMEESKKLGIEDRVYFTGLISRESVYQHLADADLFISTSGGEGLPVAVLEAMACRCPVVLSDIPPHREIAGETNFITLIPPDDVNGFASAIRSYQQMSFDERLDIGSKCREIIKERYCLDNMLNKYLGIYLELINMSNIAY